jgi:hypothetical protein
MNPLPDNGDGVDGADNLLLLLLNFYYYYYYYYSETADTSEVENFYIVDEKIN